MTESRPDEGNDQQGIDLEKNPTPDDESGFFSTADERSQAQKNAFDLALLGKQQGWLGQITGSTDSSLNIAWFIVAFLLIALLFCVAVAAYHDKTPLAGVIDKIISVIAAIAGYIFGSSRNRGGGIAP